MSAELFLVGLEKNWGKNGSEFFYRTVVSHVLAGNSEPRLLFHLLAKPLEILDHEVLPGELIVVGKVVDNPRGEKKLAPTLLVVCESELVFGVEDLLDCVHAGPVEIPVVC